MTAGSDSARDLRIELCGADALGCRLPTCLVDSWPSPRLTDDVALVGVTAPFHCFGGVEVLDTWPKAPPA